MRRRFAIALGLVAVLAATGIPASGAEAGKEIFYIQLIRGTTENKSPSPQSKPVGPKLSRTFHRYFKWDHYWEMTQKEVALAPGQKARLQLSPERAIELDLSKPGTRKVTVFEGKSSVHSIVTPIDDRMNVIGGERSTNSAWFVVVRRDKPGN